MDSMEARLTMALALTQQKPPPQAPKVVDLNTAPSSSSNSLARSQEQPIVGHGKHYGGILGGFRPQNNHQGMFPLHPTFAHPDDTHAHGRSPPFPKMDFPKFDGELPRWWCEQCEVYFDLYAVPPPLKTRFATLNFTGVAATWLQTVQRKGRVVDWEKLCALVMEKFDKHQYQQLLKKFEALKQKGMVEEYQNEFEQLAQGIMLYNNGYDDVFFVSRFVSGLKEEIRAVIALHRPVDVDTACRTGNGD